MAAVARGRSHEDYVLAAAPDPPLHWLRPSPEARVEKPRGPDVRPSIHQQQLCVQAQVAVVHLIGREALGVVRPREAEPWPARPEHKVWQ